MNQLKNKNLKNAIKELLKRKKLQYQDLANHLECSLPTIKRILGNEDLGLTRLLQICDFLDITLTELDTMSENLTKNTFILSLSQQNYLIKNSHMLTFLFEIYSGKTPKQIAQEFKLTNSSLEKYLIQLEKYEFINVSSKNKISPKYKAFPTWERGPMAEHFTSLILDRFSEFFKDRIKEQNKKSTTSDIEEGTINIVKKVSKESYQNWIKEYQKLIQDFERLANLEAKTKTEEELNMVVINSGFSLVPMDYPKLDKLKNIFGDIRNF